MKKMAKQKVEVREDEGPSFVLDNEVYARVAGAAALREIKLIESSYSIKPEIISILDDLNQLDLRYSGSCTAIDYDEDSGVAVGKFDWTAEVREGRVKCLKLRGSYLLIYSGLEDCDREHVNYFFSKVGRFATYPYFRSHFSHHISESGLVMPPLPTLRERVD